MLSSSCASRGDGCLGMRSSTAPGSTPSVRHTLAASARANTASGSSCSRSPSSAASLLTGTFSVAASTSMCRPAPSRAWRSSAPAPPGASAASLAGWPAPAQSPPGCAASLIEPALLVGDRLRRVREFLLQLAAQPRHRRAISEPAVDPDAEPQRLRVREVGAVDAPDVEAGAREVVALEHQLGEVVADHRIAGIELVRLRQRDRKSTRLNSSHHSISYAV